MAGCFLAALENFIRTHHFCCLFIVFINTEQQKFRTNAVFLPISMLKFGFLGKLRINYSGSGVLGARGSVMLDANCGFLFPLLSHINPLEYV